LLNVQHLATEVPIEHYTSLKTKLSRRVYDTFIEDIAVVLHPDASVLFSIMDCLQYLHPLGMPSYFTDEKTAMHWLCLNRNQRKRIAVKGVSLDQIPNVELHTFLKEKACIEFSLPVDQLVTNLFMLKKHIERLQYKESYVERFSLLSRRELLVLKMLSTGYRNKEISECLHISDKTVKKHRENLLAKLEVENTADLFFIAYAFGLR